MKPLKCIFGFHEWVSFARNTRYHTYYTDVDRKEYYLMNFYKCEVCKKRKFSTTYPRNTKNHIGIHVSYLNWIERGILPDNSILLDKKNITKFEIIKNKEE